MTASTPASAGSARVRVLYIGGWGRSGSTLLDRVLGQVPGVVSLGEVRELWQRGWAENLEGLRDGEDLEALVPRYMRPGQPVRLDRDYVVPFDPRFELNWFQLLHPRTWKATRETSKRGRHVHKAGKRVRQIGATFVIGAGDRVRYEHLDADSTDHARIEGVMAALREP